MGVGSNIKFAFSSRFICLLVNPLFEKASSAHKIIFLVIIYIHNVYENFL